MTITEKKLAIDTFIDDVYKLRQDSIAKDGEFGLGNLIFKELRANGYLDNLRDIKKELSSRELSLECFNTVNEETPGLDDKVVLTEGGLGTNHLGIFNWISKILSSQLFDVAYDKSGDDYTALKDEFKKNYTWDPTSNKFLGTLYGKSLVNFANSGGSGPADAKGFINHHIALLGKNRDYIDELPQGLAHITVGDITSNEHSALHNTIRRAFYRPVTSADFTFKSKNAIDKISVEDAAAAINNYPDINTVREYFNNLYKEYTDIYDKYVADSKSQALWSQDTALIKHGKVLEYIIRKALNDWPLTSMSLPEYATAIDSKVTAIFTDYDFEKVAAVPKADKTQSVPLLLIRYGAGGRTAINPTLRIRFIYDYSTKTWYDGYKNCSDFLRKFEPLYSGTYKGSNPDNMLKEDIQAPELIRKKLYIPANFQLFALTDSFLTDLGVSHVCYDLYNTSVSFKPENGLIAGVVYNHKFYNLEKILAAQYNRRVFYNLLTNTTSLVNYNWNDEKSKAQLRDRYINPEINKLVVSKAARENAWRIFLKFITICDNVSKFILELIPTFKYKSENIYLLDRDALEVLGCFNFGTSLRTYLIDASDINVLYLDNEMLRYDTVATTQQIDMQRYIDKYAQSSNLSLNLTWDN